jgi:hypothetical protein
LVAPVLLPVSSRTDRRFWRFCSLASNDVPAVAVKDWGNENHRAGRRRRSVRIAFPPGLMIPSLRTCCTRLPSLRPYKIRRRCEFGMNSKLAHDRSGRGEVRVL